MAAIIVRKVECFLRMTKMQSFSEISEVLNYSQNFPALVDVRASNPNPKNAARSLSSTSKQI